MRELSDAEQKRLDSYTSKRRQEAKAGIEWYLPCFTMFESRAEAVEYTKSLLEDFLGTLCSHCRLRLINNENKIIKRGGTQDPHWIVICRDEEFDHCHDLNSNLREHWHGPPPNAIDPNNAY